jgi:hypothetical protein
MIPDCYSTFVEAASEMHEGMGRLSMDVKEQTQRTLRLVDELAMRTIEVPPDAREAFIKAEVAKLREDLLREAGSNPAVIDIANNFADRLAEWVPALVTMMQVFHGSSGGGGW